MQEHPVPQNVTGYEFHLIGQMTLKQFMEIAAGCGLAFLVNITNLPGFVKLPAMGILALGGFALAFLPLEGRSLDRWFFAFVHSIYQPTMFFWKKTNPVPGVFEYIQPKLAFDTESVVNTSELRSNRIDEFLQTIPAGSTSGTIYDGTDEDPEVSRVLSLFSDKPTVPSNKPHILSQTPEPHVSPVTPTPSVTISTPAAAPVQIKEPSTPIAVTPQPAVVTPTPVEPLQAQEVISSKSTYTSTATEQVTQNKNLPFPTKPTKVNTLVGMVINKDEKIVDGAIVEIIRHADGSAVRAVKTNALGQFSIITPLEDGSYDVSVEKDGFVFDKYALVLNNQVVDPILIRASA